MDNNYGMDNSLYNCSEQDKGLYLGMYFALEFLVLRMDRSKLEHYQIRNSLYQSILVNLLNLLTW